MENSFIYTEEQKEQLRNYLDIYLEPFEREGLDNLEEYFFKPWSENKWTNSLFRTLFKDSLKVKKHVHYNVPFTDLRATNKEIDEWITKVYEFKNKVMESINMLADRSSSSWEFDDLVYQMLYNIQYTTKEIYFYQSDKKLTITKNTTVTKAIRKVLIFYSLEKEFMDSYESLLYDRSLLIQATNIEGTLVLSIDPMDIITASDNDCGWTSCFSLQNTGECKASVYSAVIDPHIMIAYLESPKECKFTYEDKKYTFSNKIWRAWVYYDENVLFVNKNYPFASEIITDYIYNWIFSVKNSIFIKSSNINGMLRDNFSFMYWDYRAGMTFYVEDPNQYVSTWQNNIYFEITLGIEPRCLISGQKLTNNELFVCPRYTGHYCEECGDYCREDDLTYIDSEDIYVCPDCYENYFAYCNNCGCTYRQDDMQCNEETGEWFCQDCIDKNNEN